MTSTRPIGPPDDARLALFLAKVGAPDANGCHPWLAHLDRTGYGRFRLDNWMASAHRVAYTWLVGPIPDGLHLDHLCRNPVCVNPEHLEPVTQAENTLRGISFAAVNAALTACKHGHGFTESNTYRIHGRRNCRACNAAAARRYKQKGVAA